MHSSVNEIVADMKHDIHGHVKSLMMQYSISVLGTQKVFENDVNGFRKYTLRNSQFPSMNIAKGSIANSVKIV